VRKLLAGLVAILSLSLVTAQLSVAAVTPGSKCTKVGATSTYNGKKYTCVKSGKKIVWNKGVALPKPAPVANPTPTPTSTPTPTPTSTPTSTPTPTVTPKFLFTDPCEFDPKTPSEWIAFDKWFRDSGNNCVGPFRVETVELTSEKPLTKNDLSSRTISDCKVPQNYAKGGTLGFPVTSDRLKPFLENRHPSPNTVYQIVPIYTNDAPDQGTNPRTDYKPYFDFLKEWTINASDNGSNLEIRVPDKYLEFPENISSYNLMHDKKVEDADRFKVSLRKYVDSKINFSGVNVVIILLPPGSKGGIIQQTGLNMFETDEGRFLTTTFPPFTFTNFFPGGNFLHPMWWLHELQHVGNGFDDNNMSDDNGLHQWGVISRFAATDLIGWQKWLAGFWADNQIICLNKEQTSTAWIIPSQVKNPERKLIVIPLDSKRAIVVESMRSVGLNFKMPLNSQGALVYLIDTNLTSFHDGIRLILPTNRKTSSITPVSKATDVVIFKHIDAPLKLQDFVVFEGLKITVIESGDFGDVVKVEKA
jgi:hypothetical protein